MLLSLNRSFSAKSNSILSDEYYKMFFVGLMDGDGSIQVNHWRSQYLQFRLVIKLKYNKANLKMLSAFTKVPGLGGNVRIIDKGQFVIWVENDRSKILNIIQNVFDIYPP